MLSKVPWKESVAVGQQTFCEARGTILSLSPNLFFTESAVLPLFDIRGPCSQRDQVYLHAER